MDPRADEIAAHERRLADTEFDGYCDLYARLARSIAADDVLLDLLATVPSAPKVLPILLFAAVHDLVLREPDLELAAWYDDAGEPDRAPADRAGTRGAIDPWPAFRATVVERFDELATTMTARVVQTNEVGRAAPVLIALTDLHRRLSRPLWLIEIGASAGLNLLLDRFGYTFPPARADVLGDRHSPVQLRCEVHGPGVPPVAAPASLPLAGRVGIDPRPVDVNDAGDRRWLRACLWPGTADRAAHLAAALELARSDPPDVRRGGALELLDEVIDAVPADAVPCIVSTWVLAYLSKEERAAARALLGRHGRQRTVTCITGEYEGIAPWVPVAGGRPAVRTTVLGITEWSAGQERSRAVARIQPHGRWIEWHGGA